MINTVFKNSIFDKIPNCNYERVSYYTSKYTQPSNKSKYNSDFYCINYNKQRYIKRYYIKRKTVNYLKENDLKGEIYFIIWSEKSYNIKNFNSFVKNKDKDDKEIKKKKFKDDNIEIDIRTIRRSSRLNKMCNYDIIKDLDNIKSNITFT